MANIVMIGATSTVAQAMALQFATRGDNLFCLARNEQKLARLAKILSSAYVGGFCFDFNESDHVKRCFGSIT